MGLRFLIDEDSDAPSTIAVLERHGHAVHRAKLILPESSPDLKVAQHAESIDAIVVTRNRKHFWNYLRPGSPTLPKFKRAGALFLMCERALAERRLGQFISIVEAEYNRVINQADPRLLIEIKPDSVTIHR